MSYIRRIGNRYYAYTSERNGSKVRSIYLGSTEGVREAKELVDARSGHAKAVDNGLDANKTLEVTPENIAEWKQDKSGVDLLGVDTKQLHVDFNQKPVSEQERVELLPETITKETPQLPPHLQSIIDQQENKTPLTYAEQMAVIVDNREKQLNDLKTQYKTNPERQTKEFADKWKKIFNDAYEKIHEIETLMALQNPNSVESVILKESLRNPQEKKKEQEERLSQNINYEIKNLEYEAEHKPKEMLPPKEYSSEETKGFIWGMSETDALKKYADNERMKYARYIKVTEEQQAKLKELETKWNALSKEEQKSSENHSLKYNYLSLKKDVERNVQNLPHWQRFVDKAKSGEYEQINKNYLREQYQREVKEAIKHGKPVPFDVIKQYPEFTKAQDTRERYNKGRHTSFANVSIAVDKSRQESNGVKIKRQDGSAMDEKHADDITRSLNQYQSVVGNITPILRREDVTVAHTTGTHPFLSTAAGVYHPSLKTVTMGMLGVAAHEYTHFVDETAKHRHTDKPLYDFKMLAEAKTTWNGGAKQAMSLDKRKSDEEIKRARDLRYKLGSYWERPEEIFARLVEQYTAYKTENGKNDILTNLPFNWYAKTEAYWSESAFKRLLPALEAEIKRKVQLANE